MESKINLLSDQPINIIKETRMASPYGVVTPVDPSLVLRLD